MIKQFRTRYRITQDRLASMLGVHIRTIKRWEHDGIPEGMAVIVPLALAMIEILYLNSPPDTKGD